MNKKGDIITVKRNNKLIEAINLPKVLNCNPQSLYNKKEEFIALMEQKEIDIAFISESWERNNWPLFELLEDLSNSGYSVISNVHQRNNRGGRPALIIKEDMYDIQNLTQSVINIP